MPEFEINVRRRFTARVEEADGSIHINVMTSTEVTSKRGVERDRSSTEYVKDAMVLSFDEWQRLSGEVTEALTFWVATVVGAGVKLDESGDKVVLPPRSAESATRSGVTE